MRIAISGSSGLVGSELKDRLETTGHEVSKIVRSPSQSAHCIAAWESEAEAQRINGFDAVVHLAGKSIADQRWTNRVKAEIRNSRVGPTRHLCESLAALTDPPPVLICASAIGIYGDRGDEVLAESSPVGTDFLAAVAVEWEAACQPAIEAGIRVVHARFGIILDKHGGALQKMLLPAKLFGGALGSGRQWWSWIALEDTVSGIIHAINDESTTGPCNFVAPEPTRNRDFAKTLGKVLGRPAIFPAPAFVLRAALGEMADALLLASTRVEPTKLAATRFEYQYADLESYLRSELGR